MVNSAYIMIAILNVIAMISLSRLKETFGKDLNYVEVKEEDSPVLEIKPI
jgi:hypothetical protein